MNLFKSTAYLFFVLIFLIAEEKTLQAQQTPGYKDLQEQKSTPTGIAQIAASLDSFNTNFPREKLFLHFDKPYYSTGDTIWFKAYLLGNSNLAMAPSALIYAELISDSLQIVKRISVPVAYGISWGQISLGEDQFPEGYYTFRAYTNWMQNFRDEYFFKKKIYIANNSVPHWLVAEQHKVVDAGGKRSIQYAFQINDTNNKPLNFTELSYRITEGKKTVVKDKVQTLNGRIEGGFDLQPRQKGPFTITAQSAKNPLQKAVIPLNIDQEIDLQFMPEGGYLVAEIPSRVGFKAIGTDGRGVSVEGVISDSKNNEICQIKTTYKGMGSFEITPVPGETYTAKITLPDNSTKSFPLPVIKFSGSVIRVNNSPQADSLRVYILLSKDLLEGKKYHLIGFTNGIPYYGASFVATKQRSGSPVSKKLFPTGVAHFTLFNEQNQPLNERITFINHHDRLQINLDQLPAAFSSRDSIPLNFKVSDAAGNPVSANLSISVTDDSKIKQDSLAENIISSNLLSQELKGYIEDPGFYFSEQEEAASALDMLMLTQGWRGYNWEEIRNPKEAKFKMEKDFTVSGKVTNILNKPVVNSRLLLLSSGKYHILKDTVTNSKGLFEFKNLPPVDTVSFFVQARNARGKSFNVGIELDEIKPAKIAEEQYLSLKPWYVNSDNTFLNFMKAADERKRLRESAALGAGKLLTEVVVKGKKIVKNSKNQNGPGEADIVIDEAQIQKAASYNFTFLLMSQVPGLNLRTIKDDQFYYLQGKKVRFVIDGIDFDRFYTPSDPPILNEYYDFVTNVFRSIDVHEVTGIEVMINNKYTSIYNSEFLRSNELLTADFIYIEITTRSGKGMFMKPTPGIAVYRPLPISWPMEFYKPRYTPGKAAISPDLRSTIHWQPNIISNNAGKAFTSFYAADEPGTYSVIVQGTNLKGLFGYKLLKVKIQEKKKQSNKNGLNEQLPAKGFHFKSKKKAASSTITAARPTRSSFHRLGRCSISIFSLIELRNLSQAT